MKIFHVAKVIAAREAERPDCHWRFRKSFSLTKLPLDAELKIAAEGEFSLFCNGVRIPATQFPDWPACRTVSRIEIASYLRNGENVLAVEVLHSGVASSTHKIDRAGLIAELKLAESILGTGDDWRVSLDPAFSAGRCVPVTSQLGLSFECDGRKLEPWRETGFDDSGWECPELVQPQNGSWDCFAFRKLPLLRELPSPPVTLVRMANSMKQDGENRRTGCCAGDGAPVTLTHGDGDWRHFDTAEDGCSALIDLGTETVGFLHLELSVAAGTQVEIHHGEHLDDGKVRSVIESRRFIDHYICHEGENCFQYPLRRLGARYLELFFFGCSGRSPAIRYAGLSPVKRALAPRMSFTGRRKALRSVALHTLECCMHDHYEDCPWREQALYSYDSRNQMLFNYYSYRKDWRFAEVSIALLRDGERRDGQLALCAPADIDLYIPSFTLVWIVQLYEHWLFSGNRALANASWGTVRRILGNALNTCDSNGLYFQNSSPARWDFYEWVDGISQMTRQPHALYNLYLIEALRAGSALASECCNAPEFARRWQDVAKRLTQAVNVYFFVPAAHSYRLFSTGDDQEERYYEHTQILPLYLGIVPEDHRAALIKNLLTGFYPEGTFSTLCYLIRALAPHGLVPRRYLAGRLERTFRSLLEQGATTLWETGKGAADFALAGSLCHGWSAASLYFDGMVRLGIEPLSGGFERFRFDPFCGDDVKLSGSVSTPSGDISVRLERHGWTELEARLTYPAGLHCVYPCDATVQEALPGRLTLLFNEPQSGL